MATDPKLERYLASLERALKPLPVSDRAEIVTEIKSHVLSAVERDSAKPIDTVLAAMGEPETVANRYLMERGHSTVKPPISPIVKWLVIGFLGTIALFMLFAALLLTHFSPIVSVNEKDEQLKVLGGLIDIDGKKGTLRIGGTELHGMTDESEAFDGKRPLPAETKLVKVKFTNGRMEIQTAEDNVFSWDCHSSSAKKKVNLSQQNDEVTLDMTEVEKARCEIRMPRDRHLTLTGANGKIGFDKPRFHLDAHLTNGLIRIAPDATQKYRYQLSIQRGVLDKFVSSEGQGAYEIKAELENGKISNDSDSNDSE